MNLLLPEDEREDDEDVGGSEVKEESRRLPPRISSKLPSVESASAS